MNGLQILKMFASLTNGFALWLAWLGGKQNIGKAVKQTSLSSHKRAVSRSCS